MSDDQVELGCKFLLLLLVLQSSRQRAPVSHVDHALLSKPVRIALEIPRVCNLGRGLGL